MDLTQQPPGGQNHIQSVSEQEIRVAGVSYSRSLILSAETLIDGWPVENINEIRPEHFEPLLELNPEVLLIGTGKQQIFLSAELLIPFFQRNIGVEMMNTQAACRTFNVLISDNRKVAAALLPPNA